MLYIFPIANPLNSPKSCILTTFTLLLFPLFIQAQDLFDPAHARAYAGFLMRGQQYGLAIEEYERLLYLQPGNDTFKIQLLKAHRLGAFTDRGIRRWQGWNSDAATSLPVNYEYAKLLLRGGKAIDALAFSALPDHLSPADALRTHLYAHLLRQNWEPASETIREWPANEPLPQRSVMLGLIDKGQHLPHKNPALAAGLSTLVPGLGKAYTRDWKDGAISFIFVGLNAWRATRRFQKEGIDSPWGWVHTAFGAGFYIGNIYGSHKAARVFNQQQHHKIQHEVENLVFPALD